MLDAKSFDLIHTVILSRLRTEEMKDNLFTKCMPSVALLQRDHDNIRLGVHFLELAMQSEAAQATFRMLNLSPSN